MVHWYAAQYSRRCADVKPRRGDSPNGRKCIKLLRSAVFGNRPSVGVQPYGVPYVNLADKQFGVVDSTQTPQDLIGVPFFSTTANYNLGQPVNYQGQLYVALVGVTAGPWNATQWSLGTTKLYVDNHTYAYPILSINGAMHISHIMASSNPVTGIVNSGKYIADQFFLSAKGALSVNGKQQTGNAPGFVYMIQVSSASNYATLAPGDTSALQQPIEGYRAARLGWGAAGAQPITIGFYVIVLTVTGNITVAVRNNNLDRVYAVDVPVTGGAWQWVSVTIPGDVTGTWDKTSNVGMWISICFAAGTANQVTPGIWQAGNATSWGSYCAQIGRVCWS